MRDIVATIQREQDEAIRAPAPAASPRSPAARAPARPRSRCTAPPTCSTPTGGRFAAGGVLVVGPSAAFTAYIERVLPSLGEDSGRPCARSATSSTASPRPGSTRRGRGGQGLPAIRRLLARAAARRRAGRARAVPRVRRRAGRASRHARLDRVRAQVLRGHQRNLATARCSAALAEAAWAAASGRATAASSSTGSRTTSRSRRSWQQWWPQLDPREVLLWLADAERARRYARGSLSPPGVRAARRVAAPRPSRPAPGRSPTSPSSTTSPRGSARFRTHRPRSAASTRSRSSTTSRLRRHRGPAGRPLERPASRTERRAPPTTRASDCCGGAIDGPDEYAHVLVDEAQDLSPMQWRMLGRRGRHASWTVVGDAAQASWPDPVEAGEAREDAFGHPGAARVPHGHQLPQRPRDLRLRRATSSGEVPDADIPEAVRETGVEPVERAGSRARLVPARRRPSTPPLGEVEGSIAVVTPARHAPPWPLDGLRGGSVVDPMSTKGLEYDATLIVDPDEISAESPGGVRVLYVALTRAAHRMTVLRPSSRSRSSRCAGRGAPELGAPEPSSSTSRAHSARRAPPARADTQARGARRTRPRHRRGPPRRSPG